MKKQIFPFHFDLSKLKKIKRDQLLIVFLVGVLLLVITLPVDNDSEEATKPQTEALLPEDTGEHGTEAGKDGYQMTLEEKLKSVLATMDGVGRVEVMITLKDSGEAIVEKDVDKSEQNTMEEDGSGTKRNTTELQLQQETVYSAEESSRESPFVSKKMNPKVEGVLVVAEGGGNSTIIKNISDAVLALFPIEPHKIMVVKMNQ